LKLNKQKEKQLKDPTPSTAKEETLSKSSESNAKKENKFVRVAIDESSSDEEGGDEG